jgi:NAD(P)-dependent dehydrogenase (short-subunit alcohol dehydrogenase family)
MAEARDALGPIDILVNNATFGPYRSAREVRDQRTIARTLESSVGAPLHLVQLALPDMRAKRRGWILNISSATAKHPQGPPYIEWARVGGSPSLRERQGRARPAHDGPRRGAAHGGDRRERARARRGGDHRGRARERRRRRSSSRR